MSTEPLVALKRVCHGFGAGEVLHDIDLVVAPGEIVTLIGPNGAGKTTLVRIVLGLIRPERGQVRRRSGLRLGYLPQHLAIDAAMPLTVRRLLALAPGADRAAVERAAAEVDAAHLLDRPFRGLSGGEAQRVLLARTLLRDPDLLVLDEPDRGVDLGGQVELYDLVQRLRARRGVSVLMVSHNLHLVMASTDRVICLNRHLCCAGKPEAVSEHPEYLALFGPLAARRLAVYTHRHDHRHGLAGEVVGADPFHKHDGPP